MTRKPLTERLACACTRRPWRTVAVWALALVAAGLLTSQFIGALEASDDFLTRPESKQVEELMAERLPGADADTEIVVVRSTTLTVDDPAFAAKVGTIAERLRALGTDDVAGVQTYLEAPPETAAMLVSGDRRTTIVPVTLASPVLGAQPHLAQVYPVVAAENGVNGFQVVMTGTGTWEYEAHDVAASDLERGELIGLPMALVILVVVFGAVVAALVPLAVAVVAIVIALALTALVGQTFTLSIFAVNIITMMGLAVGIDYTLFIVSRYREEKARGLDDAGAIARAASTASRAVLFSGLTVVLALLGMLIVPFTVFTSLATGAILVVIAAVLAALTLLPAVLALLGGRIEALRVPLRRSRARIRTGSGRGGAEGDRDAGPAGGDLWARLAHGVMRHRVVSLVLGAGVLIALAVPALGMERGETGVSGLPADLGTRQGYEILREEFNAGLTSPIIVAVDGRADDPAVQEAVQSLVEMATSEGRFTPAGLQTSEAGDLTVVEFAINDEATSAAAIEAVTDLRGELVPAAFAGVPAEVLVGGGPAGFADMIDMVDFYSPIVLAAVLSMSFVLLLVAFRSLVIAVKAVFMNLLSVGAAYGLLTLTFQKGVGAGMLGLQRADAVEAWVPLLLFCVLFGLSMDYQVFLLSRIRERYDQSGDTCEAVAWGLSTTAGIITGAALIMVVVFAGLASGELVMFQQIGFGLAVAIALDATLVRTVVVPSTMALLGDWNWYLPRWLEWLPRLSVEGDAARPRAARVDGVGP
jgi:RND superfamily putative drug exporter